jgi:ABC-type enterochelin transport system permease subunit
MVAVGCVVAVGVLPFAGLLDGRPNTAKSVAASPIRSSAAMVASIGRVRVLWVLRGGRYALCGMVGSLYIASRGSNIASSL